MIATMAVDLKIKYYEEKERKCIWINPLQFVSPKTFMSSTEITCLPKPDNSKVYQDN